MPLVISGISAPFLCSARRWLGCGGRAGQRQPPLVGPLVPLWSPALRAPHPRSLALLTRIALSPGIQEEGLLARWEAAPCSGKGAAARGDTIK